MRAWGLAQGLRANGLDVTVSINNSFPQESSEHEGVRLSNWGLDAAFVQQINSYDAVIISYCMGDPSVFVADNINDNVQLILDAYVPIYIEVSARDSNDVGTEYVNYMADIKRFNRVLSRGDYFLYANDAQELMYSGVLSALGVINPSSYRQQRLVRAPFGIHRTAALAKTNPYIENLGLKPKDFVVLWFGGIYPWFRIEEYLAAIKELASDVSFKFVFVGGKNPFNPNPDFSRQYDTAVSFAEQHKLVGKSVFFVDWVDFDTRIDWFKHADVIVSINQAGEENKYSWRTRVMDYVWGESVIISNGGDPLSDELIDINGAIRLPELTTDALVSAIQSAKQNSEALATKQRTVVELKKKYYWDVVTKVAADIIVAGEHPYLAEQSLRNQLGVPSDVIMQGATILPGRIGRVASMPLKIARKVRQKGVVRSAKIAVSVLRTQLKHAKPAHRPPQFVFISHPINNTGAPIVLLQIIEEYVRKYGAKRVRVIAPGIEKEQKMHLRKLGIGVEQAVFGIGFRFIRLQLRLQKDDFVLMNTAAIYDNYRDFILLWLRTGRLKHAYWFIHEDIAQLPIVHKEFLDKRNLTQVSQLIASDSLSLLLPSKRTAEEYNQLLDIRAARTINLRVEVDEQYTHPKTEEDFTEINLLLSGTAGDGRKGQVLALSALQCFIKDYYEKHPEQYRPFKLHLVAVSENEYISQQIRWISRSLMPKHVVIYDSLPKAEALATASSCNVVVCCSLNETFGLYVAEGMLMGHVVLRNNSAGVDEQLQEGVNGYAIDHTDIHDFAAKLERLLNKSSTTNKQLLAMSRQSQKIIHDYVRYAYLDQIESARREDI